jgi:hypothetical protein
MSKHKQTKTAEGSKLSWAFGRENYVIMFVGLALLALGFILMTGGGSDTTSTFSTDIFDFRRLTLAPILILGGYAVELYAIMKRPKDQK